MSGELEGWRRYAVVFAGMVLAAALCSLGARFWLSPRGALGPTLFQAQAPVTATIAMVVVFAVATGVATVVGRLVNAAVGLFVLGAGLWALRLRLGTIQELAFSEGSLGLVALETAFWGMLVLGATVVVFSFAGDIVQVD